MGTIDEFSVSNIGAEEDARQTGKSTLDMVKLNKDIEAQMMLVKQVCLGNEERRSIATDRIKPKPFRLLDRGVSLACTLHACMMHGQCCT